MYIYSEFIRTVGRYLSSIFHFSKINMYYMYNKSHFMHLSLYSVGSISQKNPNPKP